jgi:hypothetical protein
MTKQDTIDLYVGITGKKFPEDPVAPSSQSISRYLFTGALTGTKQIQTNGISYNRATNEIMVEPTKRFTTGDNIFVVFPDGKPLENNNPNVFFENSELYQPRDIVVLTINNIIYDGLGNQIGFSVSQSLISPIFQDSQGPTLFSIPEINIFDTATIYHGIPLLYIHALPGSGISLTDAYISIQSEIPFTRLFVASNAESTDSRYLGNLNTSSLTVDICDDETETFLVKNGEAQPGVSLDLRLIITPEPNFEIGNVEVKIRTTSAPAEIPILGSAQLGARGVRLNVQLSNTLESLPKYDTIKVNQGSLVDKATFGGARIAANTINQANAAARLNNQEIDKEPGEYYFKHRIISQSGKTTEINKYGTIRIQDKVVFKTGTTGQGGTIIESKIIKGIDSSTNMIILDKPLEHNLPGTTICQIEQTPFNANRTYKVRVSCTDIKGTI